MINIKENFWTETARGLQEREGQKETHDPFAKNGFEIFGIQIDKKQSNSKDEIVKMLIQILLFQFLNQKNNKTNDENSLLLTLITMGGINGKNNRDSNSNLFNNPKKKDPLLLDTTGKGVELTSIKNGVQFDLDGDGKKEQISWTKAKGKDTNSWLVLDDVNNGGKKGIQSGKEMFGDQHGAANGFEELKKFDSNGDGIINQQDPIYNKLQLWQDRNHDGISQPEEMSNLAENKIKSIDLKYDKTIKQDKEGNGIQSGQFTRFDGEKRRTVNAWLQQS